MNPDTINKILALMKNGYSQEQAMATVMMDSGTTNNQQLGPLFDDIDVSPISMSTPNQRSSNASGFDMTGGMKSVVGNPTGVDWSTPIMSNMPQAPQTTPVNTSQNVYGPQNYHDADYNRDGVPDYLQNMGGEDIVTTQNEAGKEFTSEQMMELMRMKADKDKMDRLAGVMGAGTDIGTNAFLLGNAWAKDKGTKGRGLAIGAGIGKVGIGLAGDFLSGFANSKMTERSDKWMRDNLYGPDSNIYTAAPQTRNTNNTGGMKYGGLFEDGGEQEEMPETPMEEGVEEGVEQVQEPQGEQQGMMQQVAAQVVQALNQGTSPQMIIQSLVKKGMSEQQATQLVSMVVQKIQEENQGAEQETEDTGETPEMRKGGKFKHKVGDYIKFEYGGKMREGKIKKIENGKIYL